MFGLLHRLEAIERNEERILAALARIEGTTQLTQKTLIMTDQQIQDLQNAVANDATVEGSAITLLNGLSAQLKNIASSGDLSQVEALAQQLDTNSAQLAAAVAANTPVATPVS